MALIDELNSLRDTLAIATDTATPTIGQLVQAVINPGPGELEVTSLADTVVTFDWFGKGVAFANATPGDKTVTGPLKIFDLTSIPPSVVPGVPGLIGQITGTIPIPSPVDVSMNVTWTLRSGPQPTDPLLIAGTDYVAPSGLSAAAATVLFLPQTVEATSGTPTPAAVTRYIHAAVTLSGAGVTTTPRNLPAIPVTVPGVGIPTVLLTSIDANLLGAALVMVPANSPFTSLAALTPALNTLQSTLAPLSTVARFAAFLAGLSDLVGPLVSQPNIQFRQADSIANLNDITLIQRAWYENDTEAEDELSSIIVIGHTGRNVECFNARDFGTGEGKFTLTVPGQLVAFSKNLHSATPASGPNGNELTVNNAATGGWFYTGSFGDSLSSVRFS